MSQPVGLNFKSKIPELQDDASIEEALRVYHYGVDNWSGQPIPNDSIEGNFRTLADRVAANESAISDIGTDLIKEVSASADPNVIVPETSTTVPLTIRGESLQTGNLQQWQNDSETNLSVIFSDGSSSFNGYVSVGNNAKSTTTALNIRVASSNHKGITVKRKENQSANIQEWQDEFGSAISWVKPDGKIYSEGAQVLTDADAGIGSFFLMGA